MSTIYKYYFNDVEYTPTNTGDFTLDISLVQEAGSYQYVKELNGTINFKNAAYDFILLHDDCQKIELTIKEFCGEGVFVVWYGYFTKRDCAFSPDEKRVEISPKQDSLYKCLTDNYDREFNILEAREIVESTYITNRGDFDYLATGGSVGLPCPEAPFFENVGGNFLPAICYYAREIKTTYCQGGEPQAPAGTGWELLFNNCESENLAVWYRKPPIFTQPAPNNVQFTITICNIANCTPPPPTPTPPEVWELFDIIPQIGGAFGIWVDYSKAITPQPIDNGRLLTDVIDLGLNKFCPELDLQSQFLTNIVNPVTGNNPSSTEAIQFHSISDVKDPAATEPATVENITLKDIFDSYISSKLNCFWRIDEGTKRLIIEHYNDLNNIGTIDLTAIQSGKYTRLKNKYEYDNSDIPKAENFPSLDSSIDFTGVDIVYENDCSEGVKSYNTSKFYSEVESIINDPDEYPTDGIVAITPDSLAPQADQNGTRAENGKITGQYSANAPQGMANLHDKFWKFYRPFESGTMNFIDTQFTKNKPVKKLEQLQIPLCCYFLFNPYSSFIGNNFNNGQLQSASLNLKTGFLTLNINYYE
jgi:hypothetical protein